MLLMAEKWQQWRATSASLSVCLFFTDEIVISGRSFVITCVGSVPNKHRPGHLCSSSVLHYDAVCLTFYLQQNPAALDLDFSTWPYCHVDYFVTNCAARKEETLQHSNSSSCCCLDFLPTAFYQKHVIRCAKHPNFSNLRLLHTQH